MSKKLKVSFILYLVFASVVVAFSTLANFFGGVGLNFVALSILLVSLLTIMCVDKQVFSRIKDLFFIACVFLFFEFIIYFVFEFNIGNADVHKVFWGIQYAISLIGLIYLAYVAFRFVAEINEKKFSFVERMLGNKTSKSAKKEKKAKELSNGSLEDKPININSTDEIEEVYVEDVDSDEE